MARMRATVMRNQQLLVDEIVQPTPGPGEVLVKTLACGICGSDLHALKHAHDFSDAAREAGSSMAMDVSRDVVMGHEFCAEILDFGPQTVGNLKAGDRVCSMPVLLRPGNSQSIGYSNNVPGGYGEYMVLSEALLLQVPNGLPTDLATLTEPMAVGFHAVQMSHIQPDEVALVIGCGPVGLAVIQSLKLKGIGPVIAADFSPARRKLAEQLGADVVVNPAEISPYDSWQAVASKDRDGQPLPPNPLSGGQEYRNGVYFECVGVPGVLDQLMSGAQRGGRIVVVGVCMEQDHIRPMLGITKELNLQFVLGYTPEEFAETLGHIAEGRLDGSAMITGDVSLDGVAGAFEALGDPEQHAKILVRPHPD